jgi:hypothetical protein
LPVYTFGYTAYPILPSEAFPNGSTAHRPVLLVELIAANGNTFHCMAVVDSGADHCSFPLAFALALGLDPLQMKKQDSAGVGGTAVAHHENVKIKIGFTANGNNLSTEFEVYACFMASMDALGIGLLGQSGFFDKYPTGFVHAQKIFSIDIP